MFFETEDRFRAIQRGANDTLEKRMGIDEVFGRQASYFIRPVSEQELIDDPLNAYRIDCCVFANTRTMQAELILFAPNTLPEEIRNYLVARKMMEVLLLVNEIDQPILRSEKRVLNNMKYSGVEESTISLYKKWRREEIMTRLNNLPTEAYRDNPEMADIDNVLNLLENSERNLTERVPA